MAGALIVTAELGAADFAWLDGQRRAYFPPERNQLAAHLTMFHALPPSVEQEAGALLKLLAQAPRPPASMSGLLNLSGGVAYRVQSDALEAIRDQVAEHFAGSLTAQDGQGWRPHVTILNKVPAAQAKALFDQLTRDFQPRPLAIHGLGLHRYLGGPWEQLGLWSFR